MKVECLEEQGEMVEDHGEVEDLGKVVVVVVVVFCLTPRRQCESELEQHEFFERTPEMKYQRRRFTFK